MASELIIDFPLRRDRNHAHVRFAETAQLHIVDRHEDEDKDELWYTEAEYNSMKRNIKQDVLQARANSKEESGFWIGIAHLLAPVCVLEVEACRRRCVRAVLAEQARQRQGLSASLRWGNIALASRQPKQGRPY